MNNIFFLLFISFLSFGLTWLVRKWTIHKSIIDHPNERSSHTIPTPRGGGIAIAVSWFVGISVLFYTSKLSNELFYALLGGLPLVITGFMDDVLNLKPSVRFFVQFLCALYGLVMLNGLQTFDMGIYSFSYTLPLSVIALVAIVWSINLFNFLDGIDGYISAGIIFICAAAYIFTLHLIFALLAACVLGFLIWNWPRAKIFMGDVSSTLLGYNVAIFAIYYQNTHLISLTLWLIITAVFWFDATVTLVRRYLNGENLGQAHRKHAFQRIVQAGFSHQKTVLSMLVLNLLLFGLAFIAYNYSHLALVMLSVSIIILSFVLKAIDRQKPFEKHNII